jgi:A/G-specific adenine glycosylase
LTPVTFQRRLLTWFDRHGRKDLPWQKQVTPYRVWVSEIMLQQTQVATVIPYYKKFLQRFPNLKSLASAPIDDVLALWSGLGYYARARNLHKAAQQLVAHHKGRFPKDIDVVTELPGIGRSTAGAILAFSFGQRHPILDGNVKRVLARVIALEHWPGSKTGEAELWQWAEKLTPRNRIEDYTQAIMDLGATVCTRSKPHCGRCPLARTCRAFGENRVDTLPVAKPRVRKPVRDATLLMIVNDGGEVLLSQRPPTGIWGGLWSFPQIDGANKPSELVEWASSHLGLQIKALECWPTFAHHFSHYTLQITPLPAKLLRGNGSIMETGATVWYNPNSTRDRGLAQPVEKLLNELRNQSWQEW